MNLYRYCGNDPTNLADPGGQTVYQVQHTQFQGLEGFVINGLLKLIGIGPPVHTFLLEVPGNASIYDSSAHTIGFAEDSNGQFDEKPESGPKSDANYIQRDPGSVWNVKYLGDDSLNPQFEAIYQLDKSPQTYGPYSLFGDGYDSNEAAAGAENQLLNGDASIGNGLNSVTSTGGSYKVGPLSIPPEMLGQPTLSVDPSTSGSSNYDPGFADPDSPYFGQPEWDPIGGGQEVGNTGDYDLGGSAGTPGNNYGWFLPRPLE